MTDVDAVARGCAEAIEKKWPCIFMEGYDCDEATPIIATALRERDAEWQVKLYALLSEVERLRGEVRDSRKLVWHLIEAAGGRVQISGLQLASVGPHDDCRVEAFVDARNRCTELRSFHNYSATTT